MPVKDGTRILTQMQNEAMDVIHPEKNGGRMTGGARREQLIRVAIQLFSQKGFTGTTTKDIALAAQVNEAIIFRHFARKEDLYAAILDYKACELGAGDWIEGIGEAAEREDDEAVFRLLATRILNHYRADRNFLRLMLYSALEGHELTNMFRDRQVRPVFEFMVSYIRRRQRTGMFRHVKPAAVVRAFNGMVHHHGLVGSLFCCPERLENNEAARSFARLIEITDEEAIESFTRLILDGLRRPNASKTVTKTRTKTTTKTAIKSGRETDKKSLRAVSNGKVQVSKNVRRKTKNAAAKKASASKTGASKSGNGKTLSGV